MIYEKIDQLADEIVQYKKDSDPYEFQDAYDSTEEAIEDIKKVLYTSKGVFDLIRDVTFEIECLSIEKDLSDKEMKGYFNQAFRIIYDLNQYNIALEREKEKQLSM